jgi:hypothetical protein
MFGGSMRTLIYTHSQNKKTRTKKKIRAKIAIQVCRPHVADFVPKTGIEPVTFSLSERCANQLRHFGIYGVRQVCILVDASPLCDC